MRIGPKILPPPKSKSPELLDFNVVKSPPGKNGVIRPPISSPSDESIGWVTEKGHWNPRALSSFQTFPRSAGNPLHLAVSNPTYEQPVTTTIWIDNDSRHPQQHHTLSSTPLRKSTPDQRPSRPRPRLLDSDMVKNVNGISNGGPLVSDHRHTKSEQLEPLNLSIGSHGDNHRMLIRMVCARAYAHSNV
ncbi:unnamed protein product [Cyprideis torosa]|uniref:Uncharacterized protein n=1 Tax=Cyprideis torosa TaxID=163714 RepID=A0A7R8W1Z7_9CRUS|nr:unnamed protein product [Cyprideis torosa]CAG0881448.1 unnamed protein product [Cyprideis torosa]